ncbi:hypothetical protein CYMTET_44733, partial [Cymbomonas tetramitiformis]
MSYKAQTANLCARADLLRSSLARSQEITDELSTVLDKFDERTAALEKTLLPIQSRVQSLSRAQDNLNLTLSCVRDMLDKFDVYRQLDTRIKEGPRGDFDSYLQCIEQLRSALSGLETNLGGKSGEIALKKTKDLLDE